MGLRAVRTKTQRTVEGHTLMGPKASLRASSENPFFCSEKVGLPMEMAEEVRSGLTWARPD